VNLFWVVLVVILGIVVETPQEADLVLLRLRASWRRIGGGFLEEMFHQGDLNFEEDEKGRLLKVLHAVPAEVDIYLDRAAVIPEIAEQSAALLASFNVADDVILDVVFGRYSPSGRLPIEMPRSTQAVRAQKEDLPYDSEDPFYPFGHVLSYDSPAQG
jgi:beta-glucosidase